MASTCYSLLRVPVVRVTKLDMCGQVVPGDSMATSNGIISIEQSLEVEDRQDFFTLNADGEPCVQDTSPPILKWINLTLTFCNVDPELYNMLTSEPLVMNDDTTPTAVGFRTRQGSVRTSSFAFESWSRVSGASACNGGTVNYGYFLLPWVVEGMASDQTLENGLSNFVVTARTCINSPWGVGPYNIRTVMSGTNAGQQAKLLTPITSLDHRHMQLVNLAPPAPTCGAQPVSGTVTVVKTTGTDASLTLPTDLELPAVILWGDDEMETVPLGTPGPIVHTYAAPGTYTVTMYRDGVSGPVWTGSVTI
jgi:hypothetical protein